MHVYNVGHAQPNIPAHLNQPTYTIQPTQLPHTIFHKFWACP